MEIYVDNESKLTLHGLQQYYIKLEEAQKNRKLNDLLDALEFNQVVIFVKSVRRCTELDKLLQECNFPSICIHSRLQMDERLKRYKSFKDFDKRIMVATDLFGRGIDIEKVNIVINYDAPDASDTYLHRVGRAGPREGVCCSAQRSGSRRGGDPGCGSVRGLATVTSLGLLRNPPTGLSPVHYPTTSAGCCPFLCFEKLG